MEAVDYWNLMSRHEHVIDGATMTSVTCHEDKESNQVHTYIPTYVGTYPCRRLPYDKLASARLPTQNSFMFTLDPAFASSLATITKPINQSTHKSQWIKKTTPSSTSNSPTPRTRNPTKLRRKPTERPKQKTSSSSSKECTAPESKMAM